MFIINKITCLSKRSKEVLFRITLNILALILFFLCIFSIVKTSKTSYIHIAPSNFKEEATLSAGSFNSGNLTINSKTQNYINEFFSTRNQGFLNGHVENLCNYYNKSNQNSSYSMEHEFKRIAYLRDWAIQRNIIFTSIDSSIKVKSIVDNSKSIVLKLEESNNFSYIYSDNKTPNEFTVNLIHIISLNKNNDTYIIDKDYYLDFLGNDINVYKFSLAEKEIPYSKSVNPNFKIPSTFNKGDILSYHKFNFIDHKAVLSNFDSKGYPLISSSTTNSINLPYDLGWKNKNIKIDK